jgi:site-specific DNA recombinase
MCASGTQRQAEQQNVEQQNVEQQLERLRAHVAAHPEQENWEIREDSVFRDDGYSGATLRRPGLDRLRDAAAARALDLVLVTAPDRLARNARPPDAAPRGAGAERLWGRVSPIAP